MLKKTGLAADSVPTHAVLAADMCSYPPSANFCFRITPSDFSAVFHVFEPNKLAIPSYTMFL